MTGNCFSERAVELIEASCKRVFADASDGGDTLKGVLNGSPKKSNRDTYWSPIEIFITKKRNVKNGNNKRLVAFLKGETETLDLK